MTAPMFFLAKRVTGRIATLARGFLLWFALVLVESVPVGAQEVAAPGLPLFRHIDGAAKSPSAIAQRNIRLLTDRDFPPFSYETPEGKTAGVSVDLALAACMELKAICVVIAKPFNELLPSLINNEGDVIVSGLRIDAALLKKATMTRPYFWSLGRFAVRVGSQLRGSDIRNLAGKRIGYVANSSHGAWLEKYYSRSTLTAFPNETEMNEALRTGALDVSFGDGLRLIYWLAGSASRGCCKPLDGAFVDRQFFSRNLSFLTRRDDQDMVKAFDYALDRLQEKGISAKVFARYLPSGLW
jgi:polar amino acid transport system substrate-binding protein